MQWWQGRKRFRNDVPVFRVRRMHYFAAGHPVEIRSAHGFAVAWNFDIDRGNTFHWNHYRIRRRETDAGSEFTGAQYLAAGFIPCHHFGPGLVVVVEEKTKEQHLGVG